MSPEKRAVVTSNRSRATLRKSQRSVSHSLFVSVLLVTGTHLVRVAGGTPHRRRRRLTPLRCRRTAGSSDRRGAPGRRGSQRRPCQLRRRRAVYRLGVPRRSGRSMCSVPACNPAGCSSEDDVSSRSCEITQDTLASIATLRATGEHLSRRIHMTFRAHPAVQNPYVLFCPAQITDERPVCHVEPPSSESVLAHTSSSYQRHSGQSIHVEIGCPQLGQS